jgi:hypothetical protein
LVARRADRPALSFLGDGDTMGKYLLLWLVGIPLPILVILYFLFG